MLDRQLYGTLLGTILYEIFVVASRNYWDSIPLVLSFMETQPAYLGCPSAGKERFACIRNIKPCLKACLALMLGDNLHRPNRPNYNVMARLSIDTTSVYSSHLYSAPPRVCLGSRWASYKASPKVFACLFSPTSSPLPPPAVYLTCDPTSPPRSQHEQCLHSPKP